MSSSYIVAYIILYILSKVYSRFGQCLSFCCGGREGVQRCKVGIRELYVWRPRPSIYLNNLLNSLQVVYLHLHPILGTW